MEDDQDPKEGNNFTNGIKKVAKRMFSKKKIITLVVVILLIVIIAAGLFDFRVENVKNSNDAESEKYREYGPAAYMSKVYVSEDGTLKPEMSIDEMWENDSRYSTYLSSKEALAYFLNAQLVTQYPYIESAEEGELNGTIRFYRNDSNTPMKYVTQDEFEKKCNKGEDVYNCFTITDNGSIQVAYTLVDKYTVTSEDEKALEIAEGQMEGASRSGDSVIRTEGTLEIATISYRNIVKKYMLPFDFLWSIIVMGHSSTGAGTSENFAHAIATMAYESQMDLIIDDNKVYTKDTDIYTYDVIEKYNGIMNGITKETINHEDGSDDKNKIYSSRTYEYDVTQHKEGSYTTYYIEEHTTYSPSVKIKKIVSWIATYENKAVYQPNNVSNAGTSETTDLEGTELSSKTIGKGTFSSVKNEFKEVKETTPRYGNSLYDWAQNLQDKAKSNYNQTGNVTTVTFSSTAGITIKTCYDNIKLDSRSTTFTTSYTNQGAQVTSPELNYDIVSLFKVPTFSGVKSTLAKTSYGYFIKAIEANEDTANMVDMINYIFNKVYDTDKYYKGNDNFEILFSKMYGSFSSVGSGSIDITLTESMEIIWNYLTEGKGLTDSQAAGIMGNMQEESSLLPYRVQGDFDAGYPYSKNYTAQVNNGEVSRNDFVYHGPNGGGYGLCQWTSSDRKAKLYDFALNFGSYNYTVDGIDEKVSGYTFDISNIYMQLEYFWQEFSGGGYSYAYNVCTTSNDLDTVCRTFMCNFERPADQSESAQQHRCSVAWEIYSQMGGTD